MKPSVRWQNFVDTKSIAALAVTAFIATQFGTYFGYVFPAVGLPVLSVAKSPFGRTER